MKSGISWDLSRKSTGIAFWEGSQPKVTQTVSLPEGELGYQLYVWRRIVADILRMRDPTAWMAFEDVRAVSKQHGQVVFGMTGILLMEAYDRGIQTLGFAQTTVKKALTGYGRSDKMQMLKAATERWPHLEVKNDDEADALGVGLAFINLVGAEQLDD